MSLKIILFGKLADITGNSISLDYVVNTDALKEILHKNYPALADTKYVIAVNKQVIHSNTLLNENSEVALLPPFSGG